MVELCLSYLTLSLNGHSTQTFLPFYQTQSLSQPVMLLTWLMSPWHVKILELLLNISWRGCLCCWCQNKTEAMLLMLVKNMFLIPEQKNMLLTPEQNKSHVVDARFVAWICWSCNINLSNLLLGFVDIVTWICQSCFMYLSPLAKSNQAEVWPWFQCFWGFYFELKLLIGSRTHNALGRLCLWQCLFAYFFKIAFLCMCFCIGNIEALVFWHKEHQNNEFR